MALVDVICQSFHPMWTELGHTQIKAVGRALLQELGNCPFVLPTAHSPHNRWLLLGTTRRMGYMNIFVCWELWAVMQLCMGTIQNISGIICSCLECTVTSRNIWEQAYIYRCTGHCYVHQCTYFSGSHINLISLYRDRECIITLCAERCGQSWSCSCVWVPYKIFLASFTVAWNVLWSHHNIWEEAYQCTGHHALWTPTSFFGSHQLY